MKRTWLACILLVLVALPPLFGASAKPAKRQTNPGPIDVGVKEPPAPGVTENEVRVGFVVVDLASTQSALGFRSADQGDPKDQVAAITKAVNDSGGIAGRTLVPVVRSFEALDDSPAAEQALCDAVTQDDKVFAVVLVGQFQPNARPCYARANTLMLDATLVPQDTPAYEELDPYLWSASFPSYDDWARTLVATLDDQDRVLGSRIGVVLADTPTDKRVFSDVIEPALNDRGATSVTPSPIDTTDIGTLNVGLQQAIVGFRSANVDQVMFLGGARLAPFYLTASSVQEFTSKLALSTFDNPAFIILNPESVAQESLPDAIGVGFQPASDVADDQLPIPFNDAEATCLKWFSDAGIKFADRAESRTAMLYCDAARMLQAGAKGLVTLNANTWGASVHQLGEAYQSASTFSSLLGPKNWAAGHAMRVMAYEPECNCFVYRGGDVVGK